MTSFKIDRIKKERRQSESERTEGLFQSIDWIIDKYPTIPIQPKTRVDDYSMIMQFPSKSLVTEEMYSYIQSALMINGWNISDWNENEVIVHDFFTMIDDGVPLPTNGRTPRYDEIGKSAKNRTDGLISKSKMLSKSHRFNVVNYQRKMPIDLDESEYNRVIGGEDSGEWFSNNINGKDFLGSAYYLPDENRLYHVYYDGKYDEEDVEQFGRLRHAFVYYDDDEDDDYSASTKKSGMLSKSFNDMVKSVRKGEHLEKDVSHDFKVGDILVSSWGYDQTNVQWYQVVGVTPKSVKIREIKGRIVHAIGSMSGEAVPIPDAFTNNLWFGEQKTARINQFGKVNITSDGYITAHKWDGNPEYVSWYA